ncbi:MAG: hypothetical protein LBD81_01465, partial [Holosporaceae bacterium]|nr:hypothetical protein [Holosporaceae bacterium]
MSHELLWTPSEERIRYSNARKFIKLVSERGFSGSSFHDLWKWSIGNTSVFWNAVWDFGDVV